jgi:hypothetical protein
MIALSLQQKWDTCSTSDGLSLAKPIIPQNATDGYRGLYHRARIRATLAPPILRTKPGGISDAAPATESLPVQLTGKIDQQRAKFVKASIDGLVCPRNGIYSADRGP